MRRLYLLVPFVFLLNSCSAAAPVRQVGPIGDRSGHIVPTAQLIRPAGQSIEYHARPIDLALSPDNKTLYVKDNGGLLVVDTDTWKTRQQLKFPAKSGGAMHGIAVSRDGAIVYATLTDSKLLAAKVGNDGKLEIARTIALKSAAKGDSFPCGIALSPDGKLAYVCLSIANSLAIVDLEAGDMIGEIETGMAPFDVVCSPDGKTAYVSNWGGRRPRSGDKTAKSAGSDIVVDSRGVASTGTVGVVDFGVRKQTAEVAVGLHPSDLALSEDGKTLYVANASSDTVSVIDTDKRSLVRTIPTRPDAQLPFGSISNALALAPDNKTLFVANGNNNAVGIFSLESGPNANGFIPAGWYPGAVATDGKRLFIANVKGVGSRDPSAAGKWNSHSYWGSVTKVDLPDPPTLKRYTGQVRDDALIPQSLAAWEKSQSPQKPAPVPEKLGDPSTISHVLYIIKENRTYDQLLGDIETGNGSKGLCTFGREVTPNHHALAEQFVLLDNYYCNGVLSADGHAWATQGTPVDYLEKTFGDWVRSYPFWGNDPLAYAPSGFIWDNAILHGLSFRNYGEFTKSNTDPPKARFREVYRDHDQKLDKIRFKHELGTAELGTYTCADYPGWNLHVPDNLRADVFLKELEQFKKTGTMPNLMILYLPQDHTNGTSPETPTPRAMLADNDLAIGRIVEALSHSQFWSKTAIFIIEDDPQAGFDHVDGHRSICLVASPYTRGRGVVSNFYNQTSVLHTMELILGLPPMNQMDAMAPAMRACFKNNPDPMPYTALKNTIPIDEMNKPKTVLSGKELELAELSEKQDFEGPDRVNEDQLNRILWYAVKGVDEPYPAALAGAHGKGLKALHLKLNPPDDADD